MYTKEERNKAIKLYIKYGLKASTVIHELGYPNKGSLRNWYKQYLTTGKYFIRKPRKRKYSEEERKKAVDHYLSHGRNASFTRGLLGYPCKQILTQWLSEDVKDFKPSPLKGKRTNKKDEGIDVFALSNKEKTIIVNALKNTYPLKELLSSLAISKSSYYHQCGYLRKDKYKTLRDIP